MKGERYQELDGRYQEMPDVSRETQMGLIEENFSVSRETVILKSNLHIKNTVIGVSRETVMTNPESLYQELCGCEENAVVLWERPPGREGVEAENCLLS